MEEQTNYLADCMESKEWGPGNYPQKYKDADACSKRLYKDLRLLFLELARSAGLEGFRDLELEIGKGPLGLYELGTQEGKYGSDYIGPSRNWAEHEETGLETGDIGEFLVWARKIGGHMLWPRHRGSINQARGGMPIQDRIDLTLVEIWDYMRNPASDAKAVCKPMLRKAIVADAGWFERFKPSPDCAPKEWFDSFIRFWRLESFVNQDGEPMSMVRNTPDAIERRTGFAASKDEVANTRNPEWLPNYSDYVANMKIAVEARTDTLHQMLVELGAHGV